MAGSLPLRANVAWYICILTLNSLIYWYQEGQVHRWKSWLMEDERLLVTIYHSTQAKVLVSLWKCSTAPYWKEDFMTKEVFYLSDEPPDCSATVLQKIEKERKSSVKCVIGWGRWWPADLGSKDTCWFSLCRQKHPKPIGNPSKSKDPEHWGCCCQNRGSMEEWMSLPIPTDQPTSLLWSAANILSNLQHPRTWNIFHLANHVHAPQLHMITPIMLDAPSLSEKVGCRHRIMYSVTWCCWGDINIRWVIKGSHTRMMRLQVGLKRKVLIGKEEKWKDYRKTSGFTWRSCGRENRNGFGASYQSYIMTGWHCGVLIRAEDYYAKNGIWGIFIWKFQVEVRQWNSCSYLSPFHILFCWIHMSLNNISTCQLPCIEIWKSSLTFPCSWNWYLCRH